MTASFRCWCGFVGERYDEELRPHDKHLGWKDEAEECLNCGQIKFVHGKSGRYPPDGCEWDMQTMYYRGL